MRRGGGVGYDGVGEALGEPVDGRLAAVGGAVVDDPTTPGRGVGLGGHDLGDQGHERLDAGGGRAAADHACPADVVGGQVGQRAAAVVVVVDPPAAGRARGRVGWQRRRAWMLVFSSVHSTYSPGPMGWPATGWAYRSSTRLALARK